MADSAPATKDHVTYTGVGALLGAGIATTALAVGGVVAAPFTAGASLLGVAPLLLGAGLGGWIGYKKAD